MLLENQHWGAPTASAIWKFRRKASVETLSVHRSGGHGGRMGMARRMAQNGAPNHEIERQGR